jgi:hypothetical protein
MSTFGWFHLICGTILMAVTAIGQLWLITVFGAAQTLFGLWFLISIRGGDQ